MWLKIWPLIVCFFYGCNKGRWLLYAANTAAGVDAYVRQCRRCCKMERQTFVSDPNGNLADSKPLRPSHEGRR